jgi:hypothetical protein
MSILSEGTDCIGESMNGLSGMMIDGFYSQNGRGSLGITEFTTM